MLEPYRTIPQLTQDEIDRFWSKVAPPNENGCRLWLAGTGHFGYGAFHLSRRRGKQQQHRAHRIAYFIQTGKQSNVLMVCHNCPGGDNPLCCAEEHLFQGTASDNNIDAMNKGRTASGDRHGSHLHPERWARGDKSGAHTHPEKLVRGERHRSAKLTEALVREIRQRYQKFTVGSYLLAGEYGVSQFAILAIVHRKTWKHVE